MSRYAIALVDIGLPLVSACHESNFIMRIGPLTHLRRMCNSPPLSVPGSKTISDLSLATLGWVSPLIVLDEMILTKPTVQVTNVI